jgi:broad specificity phosphatase PhoE
MAPRAAALLEACAASALAGAAFCCAWRATSRLLDARARLDAASLLEDAPEDEDESLLGGHAFYEVTPSTRSTRDEVRAVKRVASNQSLCCPSSSGEEGSSTQDRGLTAFGDADGTFGSKNKLVVAMVGLPARGKSYLVKMLVRYLSWIGFPTRIFNVGELRRRRGLAGATAEFFANTAEARNERERLAMLCQEDMYAWLDGQPSSCVAIFDATNTTVARREALARRCADAGGDVSLVFVESICDDPVVLERNYRMKLQNADYKGTDPAQALADFVRRVEEYESRYETIDDGEESAYVKLINVGEKVITRRCSGYLTSHLSFFLGNVHIAPRRIWLALHGESRAQVEGAQVGAISGGLTARGQVFAKRLAAFVGEAHAAFRADFGLGDEALVVLTGNAPIHGETVRPLLQGARRGDGLASEPAVLTSSLLNELCGGDFDGLSAAEFVERYPQIWQKRMADKLRFRYPGAGGESYLDVIARLRPILIELERQKRSVLLVSHLAVQRCLYSYFTGTDIEAIPYLPLPSGAVLELTPTPHGTTVETHVLLADDEVVEATSPVTPLAPPSDTPPLARKRRQRPAVSPHHTVATPPANFRGRVGSDELDVASVGSLGALLRASTIDEDAAS